MDEEDQGGLEQGIMECTREIWKHQVNERAKIHADRLKEALDYWNRYKADVRRYGREHIRHYYDTRSGEFFYEVHDEPSSLQRFIDENLGIGEYEK